MEPDQFFNMAMTPEFPDEMLFELTAEDPDKTHTFSSDGLNGIADQMFHFMMARTFAFWKEREKPARRMRAYVYLKFVDEEEAMIIDHVEDGALPFFEAGDINGLAQIDGNKRIPRERGIQLD